jgi:hypothetical protein
MERKQSIFVEHTFHLFRTIDIIDGDKISATGHVFISVINTALPYGLYGSIVFMTEILKGYVR